MFKVLSFMFLGILLGYLFKNVSFLRKTEKTISITILALLFILGLSVGENEMIINNLGKYGKQAALLATLSLAGSLFATVFISKLLKKGGKR